MRWARPSPPTLLTVRLEILLTFDDMAIEITSQSVSTVRNEGAFVQKITTTQKKPLVFLESVANRTATVSNHPYYLLHSFRFFLPFIRFRSLFRSLLFFLLPSLFSRSKKILSRIFLYNNSLLVEPLYLFIYNLL